MTAPRGRGDRASDAPEPAPRPDMTLIFHGGPLGDFVLSWPLVAAVASLVSPRRVVCVTYAQNGRLVRRVLGTGWAEIAPGRVRRWPEAGALLQDLAGLLPNVRAIYNFHPWSGADLARLRAAVPGAHWVETNPTPLPDREHNYSTHMLRRLRDTPATEREMRRVLDHLGEVGLGQIAPRPRLAVLHPGASAPTKAWSAQKFADVAAHLSQAGWSVRVLLGTRDLEWLQPVELERLSAVADLCRPRSLVELWRHVSSAGLFLGNDSGPSHLAGIIGVPTFALFGPTDPVVFRPLGPRVDVMRAPLEYLGVHAVLGWIGQRAKV